MKSPKPNDPRRLLITGFGRPRTNGDVISVPVYVQYETWCCTQSHEYANAFKAISDLFEDKAENKERRNYVASNLEWLTDSIYTDTLDKDKAIELLQSVAQYLKEEDEDD